MGVPHSASPGNESPKACDSWRAGAGIILGQAANPTDTTRLTSNLIFKGKEHPSGYTEPLLHTWRLKVKAK